MKQFLITGTDTEVGKTVVTCSLAARVQKYYPNKSLGILKLMETGLGDTEIYKKLFPNLEIVSPFSFELPAAPPIAAAREGKIIDLAKVWQTYSRLQKEKDILLVEALGGLGSPITDELTVADVARDWRLPTILVVPVKLGAIAATVANMALIRQEKINLLGIVLNCVNPESEEKLEDWTPINLIQNLTSVRVLGVIAYLANVQDLDKLSQIGSDFDL